MTPWERYFLAGRRAGCPKGQMDRFASADVILQARQLAASAAARLCDAPDGPMAIGYGGARGGGKSHWLLAQMGADDCQRVPGLKCLLLRKVGKANLEHFEDLRRRLFGRLNHEFSAFRGILSFANGSRIIAGHFQNEKDIDAYLGLEYDVIGIEEATTLTARKYQDISTCCRTSKPNFRPRIYSTTNPGGVGSQLVSGKIHRAISGKTRDGNAIHPGAGHGQPLEQSRIRPRAGKSHRLAKTGLAGWRLGHCRRAVFHDAAPRGSRRRGFRRFAGGGMVRGAGLRFRALHRRFARLSRRRRKHFHRGRTRGTALAAATSRGGGQGDAGAAQNRRSRKMAVEDLKRFVAGADVFSRQSDGTTIAAQYAKLGITLALREHRPRERLGGNFARGSAMSRAAFADTFHSQAMRSPAGNFAGVAT
jgi:hypothetical protein